MTDEEYMAIALKEASKSLASEDVPVGAIIVRDGEIIAKGYNTREKYQLTTAHAEINAINDACKQVGRYRLDGAIIYVTKEPCLMCMGTILSAHIAKIIYGASDYRFGTSHLADNNNFNHKCEIVGGVLGDKCEAELKKFFKNLRGKNASTRKVKDTTNEEVGN